MIHFITVEKLPTKSGLICLKQSKRKNSNGDELVFEADGEQVRAVVTDVHENEKALRQEWRVVSYDLVPAGVPTLDRQEPLPSWNRELIGQPASIKPEETKNDNL